MLFEMPSLGHHRQARRVTDTPARVDQCKVLLLQEKQLAGERRGKPIHKRKFFLVDTSGQDHLVATGEDTGSGDGHYVYRGSHAGTTPVSCTSRRKLNGWCV